MHLVQRCCVFPVYQLCISIALLSLCLILICYLTVFIFFTLCDILSNVSQRAHRCYVIFFSLFFFFIRPSIDADFVDALWIWCIRRLDDFILSTRYGNKVYLLLYKSSKIYESFVWLAVYCNSVILKIRVFFVVGFIFFLLSSALIYCRLHTNLQSILDYRIFEFQEIRTISSV